jgi:hypothetical protein
VREHAHRTAITQQQQPMRVETGTGAGHGDYAIE